MIGLCTDLLELKACRQLVTQEMGHKHKENCPAELSSLKYTQTLIDNRISKLQNNLTVSDFAARSDKVDKFDSKLPILTLDELLTKELTLSYYLDYLSPLQLQNYIIFYLTAQGKR